MAKRKTRDEFVPEPMTRSRRKKFRVTAQELKELARLYAEERWPNWKFVLISVHEDAGRAVFTNVRRDPPLPPQE